MWSYFPDSLMGCLQTTLGLDIHAFNKCFYTHTQTHTHTHMHTHTHSSALRLWLELLMSSFTLSSRTRANLEFDCWVDFFLAVSLQEFERSLCIISETKAQFKQAVHVYGLCSPWLHSVTRSPCHRLIVRQLWVPWRQEILSVFPHSKQP